MILPESLALELEEQFRTLYFSLLSNVIFYLKASWDEPTQTVVMHRGAEPSRLQSLALQLADKVRDFCMSIKLVIHC